MNRSLTSRLRTSLRLALLLALPVIAVAQAKAPAAGSFAARGASEPVAACATHAVNFVKTPGPVKSFSFEDAQLTAAKVEEWGAPFKAGEKDRVAQMVTVRATGEPREGNARTYEIKCGYDNKKVKGFSFRDVAVPIKTKSWPPS
jgi:hypothetical protein